jgi:hypothetical protein
MTEPRTNDDFLASCLPDDKAAFDRMFADTEAIAGD